MSRNYIVTIYNSTEITYWGEYENKPLEIFPKTRTTVDLTSDIDQKIKERKFELVSKESKEVVEQIEKAKKPKVEEPKKDEKKTDEKKTETEVITVGGSGKKKKS